MSCLTVVLQEWCHICHNGGELIGCHGCARVLCVTHLVWPGWTMQNNTLRQATFTCPACHQTSDKSQMPYMVSGAIVFSAHILICLQGLYEDVKLRHPLYGPARIYSTFAGSSVAHVLSDPLVVLHLKLDNISEIGSPINTIHGILLDYM